MICVYEASDPVNAEIVKDYLPANAYPQICVTRDADAPRARELVTQWERGEDPRPAWTCAGCGEQLAGAFSDCWRCGAEKP